MKKYFQKLIALKAAPILTWLCIDKILYPIYGGKGHIFMLHRVLPKGNKPRIHNHLSLEITPEHLEEIILYLIESGYTIISVDEIERYLKLNKKFVVFTLDDGYKDNLEYAYPVFKKYNCPFTIYLCNDFPNSKAFLWWYLLEELLLKENNINFKDKCFNLQADTSTKLKKEKVFYQIRRAVNSGVLSLDSLKEKFAQYGIYWNKAIDMYALSWDEVNLLSKDSMVTIGAHTVSHRALKSLAKKEVYDEMTESKNEIEKRISKEVNHFSYPFGSPHEVSDRDRNIAEEVGFFTSTTTQQGNVFKEHQSYLNSLPRITINSQTSLDVLKLQLSGFLPLLQNGFKKIIT